MSTVRIKQHLATHKDCIQDWNRAEEYCQEVTMLKRREADRKRAKDPKRKETTGVAQKNMSKLMVARRPRKSMSKLMVARRPGGGQ